MKPQEFYLILKDAMDSFEAWYAEEKPEGDKETLQKLYTDVHVGLVARVSAMLQDGLEEAGEDDEAVQDGEGLEAYLNRQIDRKISAYANDLVYRPMVESLENYNELAMQQIRLILSAYSGKEIKSDEDDDGITGIESEMRHKVFDGTIAGIAACKKGELSKEGLVRTFRALADFYEKEV